MSFAQSSVHYSPSPLFDGKRTSTLYESKYYQLQKILRKTLRVLLQDGRVIEGRLQCFDSAFNLIFVNSFEVLPDSQFVHPIGRMILPECQVKRFMMNY